MAIAFIGTIWVLHGKHTVAQAEKQAAAKAAAEWEQTKYGTYIDRTGKEVPFGPHHPHFNLKTYIPVDIANEDLPEEDKQGGSNLYSYYENLRTSEVLNLASSRRAGQPFRYQWQRNGEWETGTVEHINFFLTFVPDNGSGERVYRYRSTRSYFFLEPALGGERMRFKVVHNPSDEELGKLPSN